MVLVIIGSGNGLTPVRCQTINSVLTDSSSITSKGIQFSWILIKPLWYSFGNAFGNDIEILGTHCYCFYKLIELTLVQAMACCFTTTNHYVNQCWKTIRGVLWHLSLSNKSTKIGQVIPILPLPQHRLQRVNIYLEVRVWWLLTGQEPRGFFFSFVLFMMTSSNGNIFRVHDWPFVRGIHRSPVDSSHKGQ